MIPYYGKYFKYVILSGILLGAGCTPINIDTKIKTPTLSLTPSIPKVFFPITSATPFPPGYYHHYDKDCQKKYPNRISGQVGYQGIIPGKTTREEVEEIVGKPKETINNLHYYIGSDGQLLFSVVYKYIDGTRVDFLQLDAAIPNIKEILMMYGCPDAIFGHLREMEHGDPTPAPDEYGVISMHYFENGLEINLYSYQFPLLASTIPASFTYRRPINDLGKYFMDWPDYFRKRLYLNEILDIGQ